MSGPSDKARFYMEKAAPHFRELEEKKIFTKDEIRTMVKKKSTFEHKVLSRGTQPVDFARYAAWEINVENLRQKRCRRLRIKGSSAGPGQARIFNIFQRGTEKHPGDLPLWMSYLEYARQAKATNKFKTILTSAIRIKPTEPAIWLYAARWTLESEADMNGARSYMSRAMRMCTRSKEVWIEYAKIEMMYLAKVAKRREILGIDAGKSTEEEREKMDETPDVPDFADSADMIAIPDFKNEALKNSIVVDDQVDSDAPQDPMDTPLFKGAIPIAIYDDARKREFFCPTAAEDFFNMFLLFTQLACSTRILDHVFDSMKEAYPTDASTCNCYVRLPLAGIDPMSPKFPAKLGEALNRLKESLEITKDMAELRKKTAAWVEPVLAVEELDPGLRTVLEYTLRKLN